MNESNGSVNVSCNVFVSSYFEYKIFKILILMCGIEERNYAGLNVKFLKLKEDFKLNDLDIVEFVLKLEDIFNIEIVNEDFEKWEIIGDVIKNIEDKVIGRSRI